MTVAFILACLLVYATALVAIVYGLAAELPAGKSRVGFAALFVAYGQYAIVGTTVLLFRIDGPAFAYPFVTSVCLCFVGAAVAVGRST